jgi:hypothetical protein
MTKLQRHCLELHFAKPITVYDGLMVFSSLFHQPHSLGGKMKWHILRCLYGTLNALNKSTLWALQSEAKAPNAKRAKYKIHNQINTCNSYSSIIINSM